MILVLTLVFFGAWYLFACWCRSYRNPYESRYNDSPMYREGANR